MEFSDDSEYAQTCREKQSKEANVKKKKKGSKCGKMLKTGDSK